jgi:hypothetical protein
VRSFAIAMQPWLHGDTWTLAGSVVQDETQYVYALSDASAGCQFDAITFDFSSLSFLDPAPSLFFGGYAQINTVIDLDLTDLAMSWPSLSVAGDTSFGAIAALVLTVWAPPGSGMSVTVGNNGSEAEWYAPFAAPGGRCQIWPASQLALTCYEPGGFPVSSGSRLLRLSPTGGPVLVSLALAGYP